MSEENNYPYRHNTWIGVNPPTLEEILNNAKKAMDEIDEKVRNSIKNFEDNEKLKAENEELKIKLKLIAGKESYKFLISDLDFLSCIDSLNFVIASTSGLSLFFIYWINSDTD